jgi:hypothetical protein
MGMTNKEKLLNLVEKITNNNILSKKEFKMKVAPVLVRNNDSRKIEGLVTGLLEGQIDGIKDQDVENLLTILNEYTNNIENKTQKESVIKDSDEEKILSENYKLTELYNESIAKIQRLENELRNKKELENKLNHLESKLSKFENLDIEKVLEENEMFAQMFKITGTKLIEVPDEDIDALYIRYKTKGIKEYGKAFIIDNEIIPKTYYKGGK